MRYFVGTLAAVAIVVVVALTETQGQAEREQAETQRHAGQAEQGQAEQEQAEQEQAEQEQELIDSLADADGQQKPSVLDTHDYGPAPSLDMLNLVSSLGLEEKKEDKGWVLGDHFGDVVEVEGERSEPRAAQQGNKLARASDGPVEPSEPTYDPHARPWKALPPARVAESSDDCIGYCFDAIVASVDRDDARVARVVVFAEDGAPARAVVERTSMTDQSRSATYYGTAVRFTCFEQTNAAPVPRFAGCAQVARERRDIGASRGRTSRQGWDSKVFDLADPL